MVQSRTERDEAEAIEDLGMIPVRRRQLPAISPDNGPVVSNPSQFPRQSLVITTSTTTTIGSSGVIRRSSPAKNYYAMMALTAIVFFWFVCFVLLMTQSSGGADSDGIHYGISSVSGVYNVLEKHRSGLRSERLNQAIEQEQKEKQQHGVIETPNKRPSPKIVTKPHLVSRMPNKVVVTADVRGNLGPASVVVQAKPGTEWIHDRWQAASNMHGKQIPGEHWIQLEFKENTGVVADKIVLDWETAYADEYVLEASLESISDNINLASSDSDTWVLFDGRKKKDVATMRSVTESGKSPGLDEPRPLHVVHEIQLLSGGFTTNNNKATKHKPFRFLRLHILKSVTGWGVSLWQFDVYGFRADELITSR